MSAELIDHFRIGQPVEVVPGYRYSEWHGVPLFVVGINAIERSSYEVTYNVSENWPTQQHGDVTIHFGMDDLQARASAAEGAGE